MVSAKLIVGLGNPGSKYAKTRHNIGFLLLDLLSQKLGVPMKINRDFEGEFGKGSGFGLIKPTTYMNLSGASVGLACRFYKIEPCDVLVVSDDADLPLGKLRMRTNGSSGGHNGLKSVIAAIGEDFCRLKIGIGAPEQLDLADYVLAKFSEDEEKQLPNILMEAEKLCETWLNEGFEKAALLTSQI